jgi:MFS family permease
MRPVSSHDDSELELKQFVLGVANGLFVLLASAFLDPETVLPAFAMRIMPGNSLWIALIYAAINAGWYWPQIFLSRQMEVKPQLAPYYGLSNILRFASIMLVCLVLMFAVDYPRWTFMAVAVLLFASTSGGAYGMIPFMTVIRDAFPAQWLGRFFGWRYMVGGFGSFAVGFWIKHLLSDSNSVEYPYNFMLIFGSGGFSAAICTLLFAMIKEQPHNPAKHILPMRFHLARGWRMLANNANLRRLARVEALWTASAGLGYPFVLPFAVVKLGMPVAMAGLLLSVKMLVYSLSNPLWGEISRRFGNRRVIALGTVGLMLVMLVTLGSYWLPQTPLFTWLGVAYDWRLLGIVVACMLMGLTRAGLLVGVNAFLAEILPDRKRTTFLGFYYLVLFPTTLTPLLGALLVGGQDRYWLALLLALVVGAVMLRQVTRLLPVEMGLPHHAEENGSTNPAMP